MEDLLAGLKIVLVAFATFMLACSYGLRDVRCSIACGISLILYLIVKAIYDNYYFYSEDEDEDDDL